MGFAALVFMPDFRRQAFTAVVPAFNVYQVMSLRRFVRERDFVSAAARLDRHIDLARQLSRGRSQMVPGLVEAFELVVRQARADSEFELLKPVLERLVEVEPDLYLGRIWMARTLWRVDPAAALVHLEKAIKLVSADERAYREGLEASLQLGDMGLAGKYCNLYRAAQFGGPLPRSYYNIFRGTGLRRLLLYAKTRSDKEIFVANSGLDLDRRRTYVFELPEPIQLDMLRLQLGTLPGLRIRFHEVLIVGPKQRTRLGPSDVVVTSRTGYVQRTSEDSLDILSVGSDDEELLFRFGGDAPIANRVAFDITFSRLGLSNIPACLS